MVPISSIGKLDLFPTANAECVMIITFTIAKGWH